MSDKEIKRGDIYYADLSPVVGSEQGGMRPVLIIQNNIGNKFSPTVVIAAITSKIAKPKMPTHVGLKKSKAGLERDSVVLLEQVRTIDKQRLREKIMHLDPHNMGLVDQALKVSVGLSVVHKKKRH
ncbi:PemK family transcriptional regulator [Ligilactobacillus pobuzihii]|uniref:type II toxin-antitoxin system PemK/MazF family toxin n=1 Tax=Ligilactobacillus pobuzihii TaxID=449659 RepID=UPI0019D0708C|nr:type II toxin-antitoxin system PemK/MazF family toxin [Ligilactobacillus pobuzihii]MBN7273709.1 PemK family transcriptional regulator [Ligilactobacillus pobuzihii]HIZ95790.1 type II toxin-antitoxin system PemK/MazF family toxin [Candidatus Ligilactobacillus excrementavium]